jgi:16S rRNA G1207 methylase RsmC
MSATIISNPPAVAQGQAHKNFALSLISATIISNPPAVEQGQAHKNFALCSA